MNINIRTLTNDYLTEIPAISLTNEVYRGSLDIEGVTEWLCTAY